MQTAVGEKKKHCKNYSTTEEWMIKWLYQTQGKSQIHGERPLGPVISSLIVNALYIAMQNFVDLQNNEHNK